MGQIRGEKNRDAIGAEGDGMESGEREIFEFFAFKRAMWVHILHRKIRNKLNRSFAFSLPYHIKL